MSSETTTADAPAKDAKSQEKPKSFLESLTTPKKPKEFSKKELVDMFRGLGSMLRAQINTADALKYYAHGLPNKAMVDALTQIREDVNNGINIHEAFRRSGRFSETIVGLVQAGSDAGQLHHAFQSLADRLKTELYFEKALKKATITPSVTSKISSRLSMASGLSIFATILTWEFLAFLAMNLRTFSMSEACLTKDKAT